MYRWYSCFWKKTNITKEKNIIFQMMGLEREIFDPSMVMEKKRREYLLKNKIIRKLKKNIGNQHIIIYGAGLFGKILYFFLKENSITIDGFVVSKSVNEDIFLGQNIFSLEDYLDLQRENRKSENENLIIVAVSEQYKQEIIDNLHAKEITNYMTLSTDEWKIIENETMYEGIIPNKNIAVLMYHRVIENNYNFWKLNVSPQTFEQHMKYISENYNVIKLDDNWKEIVKPNEKYVVITFDDGYVDNYRNALPILEKYKIPATVFVSTDLIDTKDMYWWDELEKIFIINQFQGSFVFEQKKYEIVSSDDRRTACLDIRNYLKDLTPADRKDKLSYLRRILQVEKEKTEELRCVTSEEIRKMSQSGCITIGCHTKSHLSMGSNKSEFLMRKEIEESKDILESLIGRKVTTFAYPFGGDEDWCGVAENILSENEIEKTLLVKNGNISADDDMYQIPRHMIFDTDDIDRKLKMIWGIYGW